MPLFGPPNVEKMKARRDVEGLIKALDNSKGKGNAYEVREAAAKALVEIGAPAVEPLIAAFKDEHDMGVARVLGMIGDARAVEPLSAALKDSNEYVRKRAAEALGQIGAAAVEPLIAALKDYNEYVSKAAAEALGRIGDARAVEPLRAQGLPCVQCSGRGAGEDQRS